MPEVSWIRMLCAGFGCFHMGNQALQKTIRGVAYLDKFSTTLKCDCRTYLPFPSFPYPFHFLTPFISIPPRIPNSTITVFLLRIAYVRLKYCFSLLNIVWYQKATSAVHFLSRASMFTTKLIFVGVSYSFQL